jgi:hypothetical protein|tara:strand:- start:8128 stop:8235 length:108 start_codon:yes stop_codon:yes gene_type:complete
MVDGESRSFGDGDFAAEEDDLAGEGKELGSAHAFI